MNGDPAVWVEFRVGSPAPTKFIMGQTWAAGPVQPGLSHECGTVGAYRQFMRAITQSHERAPKGVAIDFAADLYQSPGSKKLDGIRPDDIGPTTLLWTLL
jgi:hypothetical protein